MLRAFLMVGIGGFIGSIARYGIGMVFSKYTLFPVGTLFINVVGCFIIGLLFGIAQRYPILHTDMWLVLATGFCGGFTTFSAFALENNLLVKSNQGIAAITYTLLSVGFGILLCRLGLWLGAR